MPHPTRKAIARCVVLIVAALAIGAVIYTFSAQERGGGVFKYARPANAPDSQ